MCTERDHVTRSGLRAFMVALGWLSLGPSDHYADQVMNAPDCPELELIAQALRTISSKDWDSLNADAICEAWPQPLVRISAEEGRTWPQPPPPPDPARGAQTQAGDGWALWVQDPEGAEDVNCVCCTAFSFGISQASPGSAVVERLEHVTLHRPATDVWDAWNTGMRLLRAIDTGSGGKICDYTSWQLDDPKKGGYWWDQHRDPSSPGNTIVSAVTFVISPQSTNWEVFLCYSRILEDAPR